MHRRKINRRSFFTFAGGSALLVMASGTHAYSFGHHYRTRSRRCLPGGKYGHDVDRFGNAVIAAADPVRDVVWQETEAETVNGATRHVTRPLTVQLKPFSIRVSGIEVDHITLDQIGLHLYSTGKLVATGRIRHDGGPDAVLRSNQVAIRLHAYTAIGDRVEMDLADTPAVWSSQKELRVSQGRPNVIQLTPAAQAVYPKLRLHFNQITHIKVELDYRRDR